MPRRAAHAEPRHRPSAGTPGSRDRRQPAGAGGHRRFVCRGAEDRESRGPDQVRHPEGTEPGLARRNQRNLRRPQQAPGEPARGPDRTPAIGHETRQSPRTPAGGNAATTGDSRGPGHAGRAGGPGGGHGGPPGRRGDAGSPGRRVGAVVRAARGPACRGSRRDVAVPANVRGSGDSRASRGRWSDVRSVAGVRRGRRFSADRHGARVAVHPDRPASAASFRLHPGRADHRHARAGRGTRAVAGGRNGIRPGRRSLRPVLRHSAGRAQRAARPAGVAARQACEPARIDDDRAGCDAVRFHLRDQGPARRHQGAARAAADPGAEGGDARRRVLRQEVASVAAARQRAGAGRARLVAGDGAGGSALPEDRRHRPPDPRRIHRQSRDLR